MIKPSDFENLEVWKLSVKLATDVYKYTAKFPKSEQYALTDQIKRSVTSIGANIAESSGRFHYKDKINFLYHSRGSLLETKSHLLMAKQLFTLEDKDLDPILGSLDILSIKLNNFIKYIYSKTSQ